MRSKGTGSAMTLSDYMTLARELQACCRHLTLTKVKGTQKLERMIGTEIKFFQTVSFTHGKLLILMIAICRKIESRFISFCSC